MANSKISVIVLTLNGTRWVDETIVFLFNQTLLDVKVIALGDALPGSSGQILNRIVRDEALLTVIHATNYSWN
jgi:hypothetical protein